MPTPSADSGISLAQIRGRRDPYGTWFAWYAARPGHASRGITPRDAISALLARSCGRERDWDLQSLRRVAAEGRNEFEVDLAADTPCPECQGTGRYVGLEHVDDCALCGGSGQLTATPSPQPTDTPDGKR